MIPGAEKVHNLQTSSQKPMYYSGVISVAYLRTKNTYDKCPVLGHRQISQFKPSFGKQILPPPFCPIQALKRQDDAHSHQGGKPPLLSLRFKCSSPQETASQTHPKTISNQIFEYTRTQSSSHIILNITEQDYLPFIDNNQYSQIKFCLPL